MAQHTTMVTYKEEEWPLNDLAKAHNLEPKTLRSRWAKAGRPCAVTDDMLVEKQLSTPKHYVTLIDDTGSQLMSASALAKKYHLPKATITKRARNGKKVFTHAEMAEIQDNMRVPHKPRGKNLYHDKSVMAEIPFNDLSHLSGDPNKKRRRDVRDKDHDFYSRTGFMRHDGIGLRGSFSI